MTFMSLNSHLLTPARYAWRQLRRFGCVRAYVERQLLFPDISHINRQSAYKSGPTLLAGFFSANLGIGEAARLELARLREEGIEAVGVDISPAFGLDEMPVPDGVIEKSQAPETGPLILHCNAPEAGRALQFLGKRLTTKRHITGYWAWELEVPPRNWELAYKYLDALWVPSTHTAKAFTQAPISLEVRPHAVRNIRDNGHTYSQLGLPELTEKLVFLVTADGRSDLARKNITGAIKAFIDACDTNANKALIIKLHHIDYDCSEMKQAQLLKVNHKNIHFIDINYTKQQKDSLIHRIDVLVSLHRAEGFGLPLAEAIKIGKKVIATGYSGPMDFLTINNCDIVPFSMVPVKGTTTNYSGYSNALWADPDIKSATQYIKQYKSHCNRKNTLHILGQSS